MGTAPASARQALDIVRAGLAYLAAADATQLSAATQTECLRELEQADAVLTAVRAFVLAGFTASQGYADDADYSARSWLIHKTHITHGAAVGHTAWAKRTGTHPKVLAALAAGQVSESVGTDVAGRLEPLTTSRPVMAGAFRSVLPTAIAHGVTTEDDAAATLASIDRDTARFPGRPMYWPLMIGAWKRKPSR